VAHSIYGVPATINCANYVYFLSLQRCQALGSPRAMEVYVREMLRLHQGQGLDIFWRDNLQCPTLDEYTEMVQNSCVLLVRAHCHCASHRAAD
jgi:geranylgeranyl diphosphate synthase type 3